MQLHTSFQLNLINMSDEISIDIKVAHYNSFPKILDRKTVANILYLNARSLRNSISDLQSFIDTQPFRIDIVVVTESWLKDNEVEYFNLIPFVAFHSTRKAKVGGGVAIYVNRHFDNANLILSRDFNNNNVLVVSLLKHNFKVIGFYRQPSNPNDVDGNNFLENLDNVLSKHSNAYVAGDFNFDLFCPNISVHKYLNALYLNGFALLNSLNQHYPTRINAITNSSTCIDHIITDIQLFGKEYSYNFFLFDLLADHKSILLNVIGNSKPPNLRIPNITIKSLNNIKIKSSKVINELQATTFDDYINSIKNIIDANTSFKKINQRRSKPYITKDIIKYMEVRDNFLKLKKKFPFWDYAVQNYKFYRNKTTKLIQTEKKNFCDKYFQENIDNPRKTWKQIKNLLFNTDNQQEIQCQLLIDNGIPITNPKNIANRFNEYFTNHTSTQYNGSIINDEGFNQFHSTEQYEITMPLACPNVTEDEIKLIIDGLSNSKAVDIYGISNFFVKFHKEELIPNLTHLTNISLFEGCFPDCLKKGIITPIHKTGDKTNKKNFRPISILPIFSKIFEYVIMRRLQDHIDNNNIMSVKQFGYTKGSNTEIAAIHILNDIYSSMDNRYSTALTCLDLSRAFDSIPHDILLRKLHKFQLPQFFYNLLFSYFKSRTQVVRLNDIVSDLLTILFGTPQGGVLSGLLFNIYINSISKLNLNSSISLYCDDISIVTSAKDPSTLQSLIQNDLNVISNWLKFHFLLPNANKTNYLLFHNRKRNEYFTENALHLFLNGTQIERVESLRILGLYINETLNFSTHFENIQSKIIPFIFALKRIRHFISDRTAMNMYFAYVQSRLLYMNVIYHAAPNYLIESLEIIQRKALRIVLKKDWYCSKKDLYSFNCLPVSQLCEVSSLVLLFKIINNCCKNNVVIRTMSEIHNFNTRNRSNFAIDITNTQLGAQNFYIRSLVSYNNIPTYIRNARSISAFKTKLKEFFYGSAVNE